MGAAGRPPMIVCCTKAEKGKRHATGSRQKYDPVRGRGVVRVTCGVDNAAHFLPACHEPERHKGQAEKSSASSRLDDRAPPFGVTIRALCVPSAKTLGGKRSRLMVSRGSHGATASASRLRRG